MYNLCKITINVANFSQSFFSFQTTSGKIEVTTLTYEGDISEKETTTLTYLGDVEDIDEHIKKMEEYPDLCSGNFDAVTSLRNELFFFKGQLMWRFSRRKQLRQGYPAPFKQMFIGLPKNITALDAIYERPTDNYILFFTGR